MEAAVLCSTCYCVHPEPIAGRRKPSQPRFLRSALFQISYRCIWQVTTEATNKPFISGFFGGLIPPRGTIRFRIASIDVRITVLTTELLSKVIQTSRRLRHLSEGATSHQCPSRARFDSAL